MYYDVMARAAAVLILLALALTSQVDAAPPTRRGVISRYSLDGATIGMRLPAARALWGRPSARFVKPRGVSYFWAGKQALIRFHEGRANAITVVLGHSRLQSRYGDGAGSTLRQIRTHFPGGHERRTCCWRPSYAVPASERGYVLAFTFNTAKRLELIDLIDRRSYLTCFHTAPCD